MRKKKTAKKCSDHVEIKMLNKLRQHKKKYVYQIMSCVLERLERIVENAG